MTKNLNDEELVASLSTEAFAELLNRHSKRFYGFAYRNLFDKNLAQDVVQDAFLKLWNNPKMYKAGSASFSTFMYRVIVNQCYDINKKKGEVRLDDDYDAPDEFTPPEELLDAEEKSEKITKIMQKLPINQRTAINLCYGQDLSGQEAADAMGIKLKALQSLISRAKENLKHYYK
jgi:RNA polymerase sigma-70 factor, ECF subfamily